MLFTTNIEHQRQKLFSENISEPKHLIQKPTVSISILKLDQLHAYTF